MVPTHWKRSQNSMLAESEPLIASPAELTMMQARITAKARETRSRRLKVSARRNRDRAVIAMPASKTRLRVSKLLSTAAPYKNKEGHKEQGQLGQSFRAEQADRLVLI